MNVQKRMGPKGTLTIPQQLRHRLGFQGGTALDITATKDGGLLLTWFDICLGCFLGIREEVERTLG